MSGGLYGADIEALRAFADRVAQGGETLANVVGVVDAAMPGVENWSGPDGEEFRAEWTDVHAVRLRETASALHDVAGLVRENADDQQETSDDLAGGGGGGVGSGVGGGAGGGGGGGGGSEDDNKNHLTSPGAEPGAENSYDWYDQSRNVHDGGQWGSETHTTTDENGVTTQHNESQVTSSEQGNISHTLAEGETGGFVGYENSVSDEFGSEDSFHGSGSAGVQAGAGYDASGAVSLSENGLVAEGQVGATVGLGASAEGQVGYGEHLSAEGSASALVGARAEATGGVSVGPHGVGASAGFDAFAGAEAGVNGGVNVAGVQANAGANVYAGIGAHANVDANVGWDNVGVSVDVGAALGIGAGVSFDVNWSPAETVDAISDFGGDIVDGAGDLIDGAGDFIGGL